MTSSASSATLPADELHPYLYSQHDDAAARHLFEVAAGLDSAVLGESEILGQVRGAWQVARANGGVRSTLDLLFRHALRIGKRARTRDGHRPRHDVDQPRRRRDGHRPPRARWPVATCSSSAPARWASASPPRCTRPAPPRSPSATARPSAAPGWPRRVGGRALGLDRVGEALARCDVVVACTASGQSVVTRDDVERHHHPDRPLLIVDIAVPRSVDRSVGGLAGVTLLDLDDLRDWADRGLALRVGRGGPRAGDRRRGGRALQRRGHGAPGGAARRPAARPGRARADAELARFAGRLADLDDTEREAVEALTRTIVAKLLHGPSVRLRHDAGTPQGERNAAAVSDLFDLH